MMRRGAPTRLHGASAELHSHRHNARTLLAALTPREARHTHGCDPCMRRLTLLAICTSSLHGLIASHPSRFAASPVLALRASIPVAQAAAPAGSLALPLPGYEGAVAAGEKKESMAPLTLTLTLTPTPTHTLTLTLTLTRRAWHRRRSSRSA